MLATAIVRHAGCSPVVQENPQLRSITISFIMHGCSLALSYPPYARVLLQATFLHASATDHAAAATCPLMIQAYMRHRAGYKSRQVFQPVNVNCALHISMYAVCCVGW